MSMFKTVFLVAIDTFKIAPHFYGMTTRKFSCRSHGGKIAYMCCVHRHFSVPTPIENAYFISVHGQLQSLSTQFKVLSWSGALTMITMTSF